MLARSLVSCRMVKVSLSDVVSLRQISGLLRAWIKFDVPIFGINVIPCFRQSLSDFNGKATTDGKHLATPSKDGTGATLTGRAVLSDCLDARC